MADVKPRRHRGRRVRAGAGRQSPGSLRSHGTPARLLAPMPVSVRLSVLVPVYNEVGTVRELLERVRAVPLPKEVIVVDDCSTDGSDRAIADYRAETPDTADFRL